jgi:hypothetical protein
VNKTKSVHRLVCEAFHGEAAGRQTNHLNGVKTDNRAVNLEWCTGSENVRHAIRLGLAKPRSHKPRRYRKPGLLLLSPQVIHAVGRLKNADAVQAMIDRHHAAKLDYQAVRS